MIIETEDVVNKTGEDTDTPEVDESFSIRVSEVNNLNPALLQILVDIEREAFGQGGMNEWFLPPFVRHGKVYAVWVEGFPEPVGVAECMADWRRPQRAYLFGISIRRNWRGKGIGTRFLQEICRHLQKEGFEALELTVDPRNAAAVRMYEEKLGFRLTDFYPAEYGPGEDRLLLELELKGDRNARQEWRRKAGQK